MNPRNKSLIDRELGINFPDHLNLDEALQSQIENLRHLLRPDIIPDTDFGTSSGVIKSLHKDDDQDWVKYGFIYGQDGKSIFFLEAVSLVPKGY